MTLTRVLPAFALILGISLLVLLADSSPQPASAASFAPSQTYQIMSGTTGSSGGSACLLSGSGAAQGPTSATRCTTTNFSIGNADANFASVVTFIDPSFSPPCSDGHASNNCPDPPTAGTVAEMPNGAIIGKLSADATLALLLSYCGFLQVTVEFVLQSGSVDTATTFTYNAASQAVDNSIDSVTNATNYWPGYSDGATTAGVGDAVNGLEAAVERYPAFLNTIFDPDGPGGVAPIQPRARLYGHTNVPNTSSNPAQDTQVPLQFLIFEPGALTSLPGLSNLTADLGYPSVTILNDPTVPGNPSFVTNFCAPLSSTTVTYGLSQDNNCNNALPGSSSGDGCPRNTDCSVPPAVPADPCPHLRNLESPSGYNNEAGAGGTCGLGTDQGNCQVTKLPSATGTYLYRSYSTSFRDLDNDGFENDLDTCPYSVDPTWNPKSVSTTTGDSAGDGIPDSCDTSPDVFGSDQDSDAFLNPQDNCSMRANSFGVAPAVNQADGAVDGATGVKNASDIEFPTLVPDGGGRSDGIGAACDDSDRDAREGTVPSLRPKGSCVDGRDNDGDGAIDFNDTSCTATLDSGDDGLYDASDTDDDNDGTLDTADSSAARPNGHFHAKMLAIRVCVNSTGTTAGVPADADNDGVCAGTAGENDATTDSDGDNTPSCLPLNPTVSPCLDTGDNCLSVANRNQADMDVDGAGGAGRGGDFCDNLNTNGPQGSFLTPDSDSDGFGNAVEQASGTDPNAKCGGTFSWPADVAVGTEGDVAFVDGTDIVAVAGQFGQATTAAGGTAPERFDLGPVSTADVVLTNNKITDNFIDGTDIVAVAGKFGQKCDTP